MLWKESSFYAFFTSRFRCEEKHLSAMFFIASVFISQCWCRMHVHRFFPFMVSFLFVTFVLLISVFLFLFLRQVTIQSLLTGWAGIPHTRYPRWRHRCFLWDFFFRSKLLALLRWHCFFCPFYLSCVSKQTAFSIIHSSMLFLAGAFFFIFWLWFLSVLPFYVCRFVIFPFFRD